MADSVGNRLGPRSFFEYTDDGGTTYNIVQDTSVATAIGNTPATQSRTRLRATGTVPVRPRRVFLELVSDPTVKKNVIVGDVENDAFSGDNSTTVTINGVQWRTTSTRGESRVFDGLAAPSGGGD